MGVRDTISTSEIVDFEIEMGDFRSFLEYLTFMRRGWSPLFLKSITNLALSRLTGTFSSVHMVSINEKSMSLFPWQYLYDQSVFLLVQPLFHLSFSLGLYQILFL